MNIVAAPTGDLARTVAGRSADLAKRVGDVTVDTARRIGPKRALIGLAAIGALVGGAVLILRYLRDRADAENETTVDASSAEGAELREHKQTRSQRKAARAAMMH